MSNSPIIWGGTGGIGKILPTVTAGVLTTDSSGNLSITTSLTNPMTTIGDIIVGGASGVAQRLAAGVSGQVLKTQAASGTAFWGQPLSVSALSSTATLPINGTYAVLSGASFTLTLPDATVAGVTGVSYVITHAGTSLTQVYTLATTSAQTINGLASAAIALYTNGESFTIYSDGSTDWKIAEHRCNTNWSTPVATTWSATSAFVFTVPASSVTLGAVYTNNSQSFICTATTVTSVTLTMAGTGAPTPTTGTLTKVSGTGPATIAYTAALTTGQPVKATTKTTDSFIWRRIGANAEIKVNVGWASGTGATAGSGNYLLFFPTNLLFDSQINIYQAAIATSASAPAAQDVLTAGTVSNGVSSGSTNPAGVIPYISDSASGVIAVRILSQMYATGSSTGPVDSGSNFVFTSANFGVFLKFLMPIAGWQP